MEEQFFTDQDNQNFENPEPQRPTGLTIACVLSFINAVWQFFSNLLWFTAYNAMRELSQTEEYDEMLENFSQDIDLLNSTIQNQLAVSRISYLLLALLYAASFYGVLQMWKLQKQGFHIYAIAQILLLIVTAVFVTSVTGESIVGAAVLTALWIGIYFIFYKKRMQ
ncbi:MAG: hypothetical protein IK004_03925 [Bacteroidales bacterium]|nr:hypothetical protein [Bacteroidales bacterium]